MSFATSDDDQLLQPGVPITGPAANQYAFPRGLVSGLKFVCLGAVLIMVAICLYKLVADDGDGASVCVVNATCPTPVCEFDLTCPPAECNVTVPPVVCEFDLTCPPTVCEFNVTTPPAVCEFNVTTPPAVFDAVNLTLPLFGCVVIRQVDLPIIFEESGCWVVGEDLTWTEIIQAFAVFGDVAVDLNFAGHTITVFNGVAVATVSGAGSALTIHTGTIYTPEQSLLGNPVISADTGTFLKVQNMKFINHVYSVSAFEVDHVFVEDSIFEGLTLNRYSASKRELVAVKIVGSHGHVRRCRFNFPLGPNVTETDQVVTSSGIVFAPPAQPPGVCGLWTVEDITEMRSSAPMSIDAACKGSRITRVAVRIETTRGLPTIGAQLGMVRPDVLSDMIIDGLFITGSGLGEPGTAAMALSYNMRAQITNLQTQAWTFDQVIVTTANSLFGGLDFETRTISISDSVIRPAFNGVGLFFSGGTINTHFRIRDTVVEGLARTGIEVYILAKNVAMERVDVVDSATGVWIHNGTNGVRIDDSNIHRCCLGVRVEVEAEDVKLGHSYLYNNAVNLVAPLPKTTLVEVSTGDPASPYQCAFISSASQPGDQRVTGERAPPAVSVPLD